MLALVALVFATAAPVVAAGASDVVDEPATFAGWASAAEGYRLRTDGNATDQDASLFFDGGGSAFAGRASLEVSGALFYDVDGFRPSPRSASSFPSAYDAYGPMTLLVDTLELRAAQAPGLPRMSVGRLTVDDSAAPTTLDGGALRLTPLFALDTAWSLPASAGRTVHFFTYDEAAREDWTASIGA